MTKRDVLRYEETYGSQAAIDLLILAGPDGFDGPYTEYKALLDALEERSRV